ncbi:MAG: glutamate 5-kinase [Geminicoccaceae bacterium]|nr:MAG: glutamate 5-kinase [Geminicoccaceae bacterium]
MSGPFATSQRVVVKVGSSLLVDTTGRLRERWLESLARNVAELRAEHRDVILVSSGAIALGRSILGLPAGTLRLEEKQAAAAAGQIALAHAYQAALQDVGLGCAQLLLTLDDTEDRRRYLNARATIETLLRLGAVPVVNENDTVATTEIRFGDNDRLSARVAIMALADTLVLLSDVDGLYTADPHRDPLARHVPEVDRLSPEIEAMATGVTTAVGTGGMVSKLVAAKLATRAGCAVLIGDGRDLDPLARLRHGARFTRFAAQSSPRRARKEWIAGALAPSGVVTVDDGAAAALRAGRSLLPAGVVDVEGNFHRGDALLVKDRSGRTLAKGLSAYDAADAQRIIGRRSEAIEAILGFRGRDELIHRDHLVLL